MSVLEIGAGTGTHTYSLVKTGAEILTSDISENSVKTMLHKFKKYKNFSAQEIDMENLPFEEQSFDVVCSAGALSYGDNLLVKNEIFKVLKPGGFFICVDSLNHNPIYRINRWIHYLRGNRTLSTLKRMPTLSLIEEYKKEFTLQELSFFGSCTFLSPLLNWFLSKCQSACILNKLDTLIKPRKSAFKFLMVLQK